MTLSFKLGRVAGIDLFLHSTFLLVLAWAGLHGVETLLLVSAVFGCVVLHELGHALTARAFGVPTRDITLYPIGGVARLERMPRAPGAEMLITLAGPLVNVAIAATLAMALWASGGMGWESDESLLAVFTSELLWINVVLAVFNMIPAFPMDGGRILRAALTVPLGRYRATEVAAGLGRGLALVFPLVTSYLGVFSVMHLVLAVFLFFAAGAELRQVRSEDDDHNGSGRGDGIWAAPPGYRWVNRGQGTWQLAPIHVTSHRWR